MILIDYIPATRNPDLVNTLRQAALSLLEAIGEVYGILARIERGDEINRSACMTRKLSAVAWCLARITDFQQFLPVLQVATDVNGYGAVSNLSDIHRYGNRLLTLGEGLSREFRYTSLCHIWGCWHSLCVTEGLDPNILLTVNHTPDSENTSFQDSSNV